MERVKALLRRPPAEEDEREQISVEGILIDRTHHLVKLNGEELPLLNHSKGLYYIAHLLKCPFSIIPAIDLQNAITGRIKSPVEIFEMTSEGCLANDSERDHHSPEPRENSEITLGKSKEQYEETLKGFQEELRKAERNNDTAEAKKLKELITLTAEQMRDSGIYPNRKEIPLEKERARSNVTKAIKSANKKISQKNPALGEDLKRIKTGYTCQYNPDHTCPDWNF